MANQESSEPLPDGRRDRWRAHREARRADLIGAVITAVGERGPDVGMDDISAVSGVAKPVFYRYFADKTDLFLAVGRAVAEDLVQTVMAAIDSREEPREKLEAGIEAYVATVEAKPDLYRFVAAHQASGRSGSSDLMGDYASVVGAHASRVIGGFLRAAGLDSGAADPWGYGVVGMARAATDRWLENQSMSRADLVRYLTDLVWPGLTSQARRAMAAPLQR
ncbi:MAG: TetR/AcrR family transcriptional regulator [Frankiaceae bacterium]|nr:TetR/AcrR family transcriptional regulator [Frankiaceae bacterium]MBV9872722.1 TetR/AcrR family transcriptional regulator [Frankiaceae bacterium]